MNEITSTTSQDVRYSLEQEGNQDGIQSIIGVGKSTCDIIPCLNSILLSVTWSVTGFQLKTHHPFKDPRYIQFINFPPGFSVNRFKIEGFGVDMPKGFDIKIGMYVSVMETIGAPFKLLDTINNPFSWSNNSSRLLQTIESLSSDNRQEGIKKLDSQLFQIKEYFITSPYNIAFIYFE
jgi:hypothetical protein